MPTADAHHHKPPSPSGGYLGEPVKQRKETDGLRDQNGSGEEQHGDACRSSVPQIRDHAPGENELGRTGGWRGEGTGQGTG